MYDPAVPGLGVYEWMGIVQMPGLWCGLEYLDWHTEESLLRCPHTQHRQTNSLDNEAFQM